MSSGDIAIPVTTTKPSFQMPLEWEPRVAMAVQRHAADLAHTAVVGTVLGYSTPSTADVGGCSLRLEVPRDAPEPLQGRCNSLLALRRGGGYSSAAWLPAIASVPGDAEDRAGKPRFGLVEVVVIGRPTAKNGITFLHEAVLRQWAQQGSSMQICPLERLCGFTLDDGSGPWLRDKILQVSSLAEDYGIRLLKEKPCSGAVGVKEFLAGSGLQADPTLETPPADEWDLARQGQLHRDC
eukprot:gnl/TRDRNA2_/TRDRNA2_41553_c0_seq1.p1 gnl/TRDRNA2_/TRDRNA2_41553_c0~~gnl/TRDRNA2_/TRDRNA2_41553_c0_seq1.p1  ORF type:complete len:238 (-),score=37.74 gnl/TRDRNA2_/TRDRNA2_41553_c0_seq1:77-790(-)